jgi:16S rRNA processing protein RimM
MYLIGKVLRPQGIKGEVKVIPVSPRPERFEKLKKVFLKQDNIQTYTIEKVRLAGESSRFVYIKFKEITTRTAAESLRDAEILIEQGDLIQLQENEYFIHDLIGCRVVSEQGAYIGEIVDVWQLSSNDIYVLQAESGKEILIPAIRDVVKKVIPEAKQVIIHLLEGLLD